MEGFVRPSLSTITSTAQAMLTRSGGADVVVLVGGFSASPFVRRELTAALETRGGPPVVAPGYGAVAVLEGGSTRPEASFEARNSLICRRLPGILTSRDATIGYSIVLLQNCHHLLVPGVMLKFNLKFKSVAL
jgi:hypothetical protein